MSRGFEYFVSFFFSSCGCFGFCALSRLVFVLRLASRPASCLAFVLSFVLRRVLRFFPFCGCVSCCVSCLAFSCVLRRVFSVSCRPVPRTRLVPFFRRGACVFPVSCCAFLVSVLRRLFRLQVGRALRVFPHTAGYCPAGYPAGRQHSYLRTVIVAAAVYRGFGSELRLTASPLPLTFRHWAGVSPYTSSLRVCRGLCFW